jgi:hypothetical protein
MDYIQTNMQEDQTTVMADRLEIEGMLLELRKEV